MEELNQTIAYISSTSLKSSLRAQVELTCISDAATLITTGGGATNQFGQRAAACTLSWQQKIQNDAASQADVPKPLIFSYVHDDGVLQRTELQRQVLVDGTLAPAPHSEMSLAIRADAASKLMRSEVMAILADTGAGGHMLLMFLALQDDGTLETRPPFSLENGPVYRQQDKTGNIWEWRITCVQSDEFHVAPASSLLDFGWPDLSVQSVGKRSTLQPPDTNLRLLITGEIVAAHSFNRRKLYVEYTLLYNADVWRLLVDVDDTRYPQPGLARGVTQVSAAKRGSTGMKRRNHFGQPLDYEFELLADDMPPSALWPCLFFQVCAWGRLGRGNAQGYGWLDLGQSHQAMHEVATWRPARSCIKAWCRGGSPVLNDIAYVKRPSGIPDDLPLNRFGFQACTSGVLQVRLQTIRRWASLPEKEMPPSLDPEPPSPTDQQQPEEPPLLILPRPRPPQPRRSQLAPVIMTHPADLQVMQGAQAEFCIYARGTVPLEYQWFRNGQPLQCDTCNKRMLTLTSAQLSDRGSYHCSVRNEGGVSLSRTAELTVEDQPRSPQQQQQQQAELVVEQTQTQDTSTCNDAAQTMRSRAAHSMAFGETQTIGLGEAQTEQPAWRQEATQTLPPPPTPPRLLQHPQNCTLTEGGTALLSVRAEGRPPLAYQWLRYGVPLSLQTGPQLQLADVDQDDVGSYSCRVTNEGGAVTSSPAFLNVEERGEPPTIHSDNSGELELIEGDELQLTTRASGQPPLLYQWSRAGQVLRGQNTARYQVTECTLADVGSYSCRVSNPWGKADNKPVDVRVLPAAPQFVMHPQKVVSVEEGDVLVLEAKATARRPFTYQWLHKGLPLVGAGGSRLHISAAAAHHRGSYTCSASNQWGSVRSDPAHVGVQEIGGEPVFIRHPRSCNLIEGDALFLSVLAEGRGEVKLQWLREKEPVPGGHGQALKIAAVGLSDGGAFTCVATNDRGTATSRTANVVVAPRIEPPHITVQPQHAELWEGQPFELSVQATGTEPLSFQWLYEGRRLRGEVSPQLRVPAAARQATGAYTCAVSNAAGSATSAPARVQVTARGDPPVIVQQPEGIDLREGLPLRLSIAASGTQPLQYQWTLDGHLLQEGRETLEIAAVTTRDAGSYACKVSNAWGSVTSSTAVVEVSTLPAGAPIIARQPADCSVAHLDTVVLSVMAMGETPLSYQWWSGSAPIEDATQSRLIIEGARKALHQGLYCVQVANAKGAVVSEEAMVEVEAVDILSIIERFIEERQITFQSLFRQYNRSRDNELGPAELEALVLAVYPLCLPSELRHFQVILDTEGSGRVSYKQFVMAFKEAKGAGHWLEGGLDGEASLHTLLAALAVRGQEQGTQDFRKVFAAFDAEGEGSLGYAGIAALVRRQLPNVTAAELRVIMSHMHLLDKDGDGRLTCQELWDGVRHTPTVGPTARRDLRRVAGLAKTPAEREAALRRSPPKTSRRLNV